MLEQAEIEYLNGDEEMAYMYYMKYFQLINLLKYSKTYEKYKEQIRNITGNNTKVMDNMNRLEELKTSLLDRYVHFE